jgi:hypothetical protein
MPSPNGESFEELRRKRFDLREKLAAAWELQEPLDLIRQIEEDLKRVWTELEAIQLDDLADLEKAAREDRVDQPPARF